MQVSMSLKMLGSVLSGMIREALPDSQERKAIQKEYQEILLRAKDIGSDNNLLLSYALAAFFIAMNRNGSRSATENITILENGMRKSKLLKLAMGDSKTYFSEKKMAFRREWAKKTHERKYENDWVVDVLEQTEDYVFGLDYHECGVCKLCKDENCPELAKYLCKLDFMLVDIMGIRLERTMTLAEGYEKCDFRFIDKRGNHETRK